MKKPLLNELDRRIIRELPNDSYAKKLMLKLEIARLKREIGRTLIEPIVEKMEKWKILD